MNNILDVDFLSALSTPATRQREQQFSGSQRLPVDRTAGVAPGSFWCDMSANEYHNEAPGLSSSRMKHVLVSPAMYQLKIRRPMMDNDALRLGRMLHTCVLEPHLVDREFAIWDEGRRQGGAWDSFRVQHEDKTILTDGQLECAHGMSRALKSMDDFPLDAWLQGTGSVLPAVKERSLFWTDEETGLMCKARIDAMSLYASPLAGDLKSTRSAKPDDFIKDVFKFRYDLQAAHYSAGIKAVFGVDAAFAFFAVEKEEPHVARTFLMTRESMEHGERYRRYCLRLIQKCMRENSWPKQPKGARPTQIDPPFFEDKQLLDLAAGYGLE